MSARSTHTRIHLVCFVGFFDAGVPWLLFTPGFHECFLVCETEGKGVCTNKSHTPAGLHCRSATFSLLLSFGSTLETATEDGAMETNHEVRCFSQSESKEREKEGR